MAGSGTVRIYNVKANAKLSFWEDAPIYTAINTGQESLHPHQWRMVANIFRCEKW